MPDFKSNNTFTISENASDYSFTSQGNLIVPFQRLIDLDINVTSIEQITDEFDAKDENGDLRDNIVEEEIRIQVFLDNTTQLGSNTTQISDQTFKFYYKYEPSVVTTNTYLPINVELVNGINFCDTTNREQRTLYVKRSDLNNSQFTTLNNNKKVFGETIYSNDRGVPWNGTFTNGDSANFVAFTDSGEENSYYKVQAVEGTERNEVIQEEGTGNSAQFKFVNEVFGCSAPPEVNPVQLFITPRILIPGGRESAICFGTTRSSVIPQRETVIAYIQGDTNDISGKILYDSNGIDPLPTNNLNFGPGRNAVTVRLPGENQPYYSIEYIQNLTNGKYGAKVSESSIGTCPISPSEPTDCDKLDYNIAPTSSDETIICGGTEYEWNGSTWVDVNQGDNDRFGNPNEGLDFDRDRTNQLGGTGGTGGTGGPTPLGGSGGSGGLNEGFGRSF